MNKYRQCHSCEMIGVVSDTIKDPNDFVCPECGRSNFSEEWPNSSVQRILDIISSPSDFDSDFERIACLLVTSCMEDLMRELIVVLAQQGTIYDEISLLIDPLLDGYQGKDRQLKLFRKLAYGSFKEECTQLGYPDFVSQWSQIVERRNHFAHTATNPRKESNEIHFGVFIHHSLEVFRKISNKYNVETTNYQSAMERREIIEIEE